MTRAMFRALALAAVLPLLAMSSAWAQAPARPAAPPAPFYAQPMDDAEAARLAARVREETRHAWRGYMKHAKGHDALKPLSKKPHDWYPQSLLMTPVDALDTLILMGLKDEAVEARELIATRLSFDHDMPVQNFEVVIRLLGGLLSGYQMTGDERLLALADDLGTRLLPVFETPTGLPYTHVNLSTGEASGKVSNPAETGTLLLEFGTLSKLTGKPVYYDKAKRALVATFERRSKIGLVGSAINVETGEWTDRNSHVGGGIDSYYEYLLKCWKLFGDEDCKRMWEQSVVPMNRHLADELGGGELWYGHADMDSGVRGASQYGALDAFLPAVLALAGDIDRASRLQKSGLMMWRLHGIEPEALDYRKMEVISGGYQLRPEIIESAYYLHHFTGDLRWRAMGREFFDDFERNCRTDTAYAAIKDVRTMEKRDSMESFVLAETFKYYWLLFSPPSVLDFDGVVFNTEAHPLRRTWKD